MTKGEERFGRVVVYSVVALSGLAVVSFCGAASVFLWRWAL